METNLAKLEAALDDDPHDEAARAVYADALLESGETTRGELIALTAKLEGGDDSDELALRVRQLEQEIEREIAEAIPKLDNRPKFVLCQFRHGLVDRIELGGLWALGLDEQNNALAKFMKRPELMFVRGADLRRIWPEQEKKQAALTKAVPKIFRTTTTEWLGLGPNAVKDEKELDALATTFPKLNGVALTLKEAAPFLNAIATKECAFAKRLIDFEIAGDDVSDPEVEQMLALSPHLPKLQRYVMFWETADDDLKLLTPLFDGKTFPNLTSLGVILSDTSVNARFLDKLVKSKLFKRLKSVGFSCDPVEEDVQEWLEKHKDAVAHLKFFATPSFITTGSPEWDDARDELATALYNIDRDEEALRIREDLVIANPKDACYWDNLGDSFREVERHEEALAAFEKATTINKSLDTAWSGKADSLSDLNREKEALYAWNRAVKLDPHDAYTQNGRAITLGNLGRHAEALKGYNASIKVDQEFIPPYSNRADVFVSMQRFADALKGYQHVLDAKDNEDAKDLRAYVLNRVGLIHLINGDRENAIKNFNQAIKEALADKDEEVAMHPRTNLARMHIKAGKHRDAFKIFDVLCKEERVDWQDKHGRAWTLLEMGSAKDALTHFENDCGLTGAAAERLFALEALGKKQEALKALTGHDKRPMSGCLYRWVSESLLHAILLDDNDGGDGGGPQHRQTRKQALVRARATPHDPMKHFEALRKRAEKEKGKPQCELVSCISGAALVAILAALMEGKEDEAQARAAALIDHLSSVDLMNELGLKWAVTRAARLARLDEQYPYITSVIAAAEVMTLPSKVKLPRRPPKKKSR